MKSLLRRLTLFSFVLIARGAFSADQPPVGADVPVKQVVLFSSGVGYFEHFGTVKDNGSTELRFETDQINDVLKSLVLQDLDGGKAGTVSYPSQEPINRTLKSFQIDITANPALEEMLNQLRGAAITLKVGGHDLKGTIVGLQKQKNAAAANVQPTDVWTLNLKAGRKIMSIPMDEVHEFSLDDAKLDAELDRALATLALSRDQDKKPVTINFRGQGERRVRVGYVVETPVWKTSYRLILGGKPGDNAGGKLQGWAIVENQTDGDWNDVQLSLVSGRPISFIQELYLPLYVPRPVVWPETYSSLRPQTYKGGISPEDVEKMRAKREKEVEEAENRANEAPNFSLDQGGRAGRGGGGLFGGSGGRPTTEPARDFTASVMSMASVGNLGELFEYSVGNVSISRQRSAMIPIVTDAIEVHRVSIYNPAVLPDHPLNGARLKNTTGKHLLQGPVTVLDAGAYAGDAKIDDVPQGQSRFVSYGIDLKTSVTQEDAPLESTIQTGKIVKGVLQVTQKFVLTQKLAARNNSDIEKTVVFELPSDGGQRKLVEPAKYDEKTDDLYRISRVVPAGKGVSLRVVMETIDEQVVQIATGGEQLVAYATAKQIPQTVRDALAEVAKRQQAVAELQRSIKEREKQASSITAEQSRIRDNMKSVSEKTDYYQRLLKKLDEQETTLEKLHAEVERDQATLAERQKALQKYIAELNDG
jgi:hypothetical protein